MTPTSIAERLDALALEATEGIELADPRESRRRWGVAPLLAAACLVVIAGLAVAWLARDVSHERIEIRTDEGFVRNELP